MKKNTFYLVLLCISAIFTSCEKDLERYSSKPAVYFNEAGRLPAYANEPIKDSTVFSFSLSKFQETTVDILVTATGAPTNQDRPYNLLVSPNSTAKAGTHYEILTKTFSIKKNKTLDTVKIKFFRTSDMQTTGVLLSFDLKTNDNFETAMNNRVSSNGKVHSFVNYRWWINDIIKKPGRWLDGYLGVFTRKKLLLMVEVLGVDPGYMDTSMAIAEMAAYGKFMQRYLNEQAAIGKPVYEEDGTLMAMGVSSQ